MRNLCYQEEWYGVKSLFANSIGLTSNNNKKNSATKSKSFVSRLSLSKTLDFHEGCVNSLNFNTTGNLIASGSDDLKICIWEWCKAKTKPVFSYDSGHHGNVFQSKFMPFSNDAIVVSCARDGQVRVGYLSSEGLQHTKKIVQHKGSAHKLSVSMSSAHLLRSAGEDGIVYNIDLRDTVTPQKLVTVRTRKSGKVALYSIHNNPFNDHEFAVCGRDPWARIFDERMVKDDEKKNNWVQEFCPDHLKTTDEKSMNRPNVTCLMYNYSGTELVCSYNDEDIYLFDTTQSTESKFTHVYKGHRNSETVKGVNFFGPRSEYIISGSDCGHVFIWDKHSEEIVTFLQGDQGVVNVLEPHPDTCTLATAGLEHNIKIWEPIGDAFSESEKLNKQMKENLKLREEDKKNGNGRDLFYLMMIMNHMRRHRRQRRRRAAREQAGEAGEEGANNNENDDDISTDDDNDDDDSEMSTDDDDSNDGDGDEDMDDDVTPNCVQS